jgi:hypothetical protein
MVYLEKMQAEEINKNFCKFGEELKEQYKVLQETIDRIDANVGFLRNAEVNSKEKLNIVYEELRKKKCLFRADIDRLLQCSGQHSHNVMNKLQQNYPDNILIKKDGNANKLVYLSEADKKKRQVIEKYVRDEGRLQLGRIMDMFKLEYQQARALMMEIATEKC